MTIANSLTAAELKRRGMAAIEDGLTRGVLVLVKHNKPTAVVLSDAEYKRLLGGTQTASDGVNALQWLLTQTPTGRKAKTTIDTELKRERNW